MDYSTIKKLLDASGMEDLRKISKGSNVPLPTLVKIKYNQTKSPKVDTAEKLSLYFMRVGT